MAQKNRVIYFVEVKYRAGTAQGGGLEYIASQKLRRMNFAARVWTQSFNWHGDWRLMAAAVGGPDCEQIEVIELD